MNDEIKEIDNSDLMDLLETTSKKDFYRLTLDHELVVRLYNWITNLQKENEELNRMCEIYSKSLYNADLTRYKSRCEKIRNYVNSTNFVYDEQYKKKDKIENILNGGDEE